MRLLITGASGLYGSKLAFLAEKKGHSVFSAYSQHKPVFGKPVQLDVSNQEQVTKIFKEVAPEVVVHAASLTDVDTCELNHELAWRMNVEGTENVAKASRTHDAFLIYISTDYVFNGERGNYRETDLPDPINYYGLTKVKAEEQVKSLMDEHCIARPSVIYGATPAVGKINFALWIIEKLRRNEQVKIVTDQWVSPTLNSSLADMTLEVMERRLIGIYHLSGATRINRCDFAKLIAQTFNLNGNMIRPVISAEMSWAAKRPRDSSLDTAKAQQRMKNTPLSIERALQEMKQELAAQSGLG